jgi:hypothetical protein
MTYNYYLYKMETFKKILGHSQYIVSPTGVVKRIDGCKGNAKEYVLKQSFHRVKGKEYPNGYMYVTLLTKDGVNIHGEFINYPCYNVISVHRLVALAYIDNPDKKPQVNHIDLNKLNNNALNLEWSTVSENIQHSYDNGRVTLKGSEHWLHGHKASIDTKKLMSEAKKGVNHPKFKGFYMVKHFRYNSSKEAEKHTNINSRTIQRWCKKGKQGSDYYFVSV